LKRFEKNNDERRVEAIDREAGKEVVERKRID